MDRLTRRLATEGAPIAADGVRLEELPPPAMLNLRGDARDPAFVHAVGTALGCAIPVTPNSVEGGAGLQIVWLGPDEWLVLGEGGREIALESALRAALSDQNVSIVDVSGNRALLRLGGQRARQVLEAGCSLDLHPRVFGPGRSAQTLIARAQALLVQQDDSPTYDIFTRRSFAAYLWTWLEDAASGS